MIELLIDWWIEWITNGFLYLTFYKMYKLAAKEIYQYSVKIETCKKFTLISSRNSNEKSSRLVLFSKGICFKLQNFI